jgi:pyruvate dehydrogenase E1 component alpha subunit
MMAELFGKKDGLCKGKGGSMHIADLSKGMLGANAIVGGSPPLVIGAALTAKVKKSGAIAAAFIGDGASNQGTVFEAMNMAVVLQLPAIFVIENNGYGEFTGVEYAVPVKDIAARAAGFGMPGVAVNGFDFFAVHGAMREAAERARAGGGPSVIETRSSRYHGHFVGDPQMYRGKDEVENVRRDHDALALFRKRVTEAALLEGEELDRVHQGVLQEIEDAVTAARNSEFPPLSEILSDVYVAYA